MNNLFHHQNSFTTVSDLMPPFCAKDELLYFLKRLIVDIVIGLPVMLILIMAIPFKSLLARRIKGKILLGTIPLIIFKTYHTLLSKSFDVTLFAMEDWSKGSFHHGKTLHTIAPLWIARYTYFIGPYYAFVWALCRFEIFFLYFDSGFLERTLWWRMEPVLLQWYGKKTVMVPYGSDVWSVESMPNLIKKVGLELFKRKYFGLDFKRRDRNYWWCKYATVVWGIVDFVKYLPRADILTLHGHIILEEDKNYLPLKTTSKVKIIHIANDVYRKGSIEIDRILKNLSSKRNDFEYEILTGLRREEVMQKINEAHIVIDTPIDGFIQYTTMEAALKGKIVMAHLDHKLNAFFCYLNPLYYRKHFDDMPIVDIDLETLEAKLIDVLEDRASFEELGQRTHAFAQAIIKENSNFLIQFVQALLNNEHNKIINRDF